MPDKTDKNDDIQPNVPMTDAPVSDAPSEEAVAAAADAADATADAMKDETLNRVLEKVEDADSILVVLSKDPSVDEMTAAIAMTISLDRMGKHATAIYSGKTPNALEFLEPEKTFETNTNSLQDFIIALDKEKADHLRYKIEGDFVKVYITPYRTTISEKDLEFTHGEVNVDMVISFNVPTPEDLDAALAQHGRIMHDAVSINISNKIPGRIGGLEWNDPMASSVSEMVLKFLKAENQEIEKDVATALLTGIIAETERFSNDKTTPETMAASAELMQKGADQQIVASHISEMLDPKPEVKEKPKPKKKQPKPSSIDVSDEEPEAEEPEVSEPEAVEPTPEPMPEVPEAPVPDMTPAEGTEVATTGNLASVPVDAGSVDNTISPEAQLEQMISGQPAPEAVVPEPAVVEPTPEPAAEPAIPEVVPVSEPAAPEIKPMETPMMGEMPAPEAPAADTNPIMSAVPDVAVKPEVEASEVAAVPTAAVPVEQVYNTPADTVNMNDGVMSPVEEIEQPKDYGAMMEQELAASLNAPETNPALGAVPDVMSAPEVAPAAQMTQPVTQPMPADPNQMPVMGPVAAPAESMMAVPEPMAQPEVQQMAQPMPVAQPEMPMAPVAPGENPAINAAPVAPEMPEVQPIAPIAPVEPEVAAGPTLPPPPMPPVAGMPAVPEVPAMPEVPAQPVQPAQPQDTSSALGIPEAPEGVTPPPEPVNPVIVQPIQDPASVPPVQDPGSFKIPGM